ncbi:unnamed protein product [Caenorhabditis nigoni]
MMTPSPTHQHLLIHHAIFHSDPPLSCLHHCRLSRTIRNDGRRWWMWMFCSTTTILLWMWRQKKRSLPDKPTFFGIAAGDDDVMCNNTELKKIILENMQSTSVDSSKAVNGALEAKQLNRFVVVCSENPFVFTVRADTAYCGARKNEHNCHAFSM